MKIVILDGYGLNPGDISWAPIEALADEVVIYDRTAPADVVARAAGAEIVLTNKTVLNEEEIEALPARRYIGVTATGYNVVDLAAARRRGIVVTNIPAYSTASVAQMVFAHILNIASHVALHDAVVKEGVWTRSRDFCFWLTPQTELAGKTIGLVGLGHTGMATARLALAFGMQVVALTSKPQAELPDGIRSVGRDELLRSSDFLSLHCPLTDSTRHFINAESLALMKPTAVLINTGRGPLVDEAALAAALRDNRLAAAGVDVLSTEPPLPDNPLLAAPRCYITPHMAWATIEARTRLMAIAADNIKAFQAGETVNVVS